MWLWFQLPLPYSSVKAAFSLCLLMLPAAMAAAAVLCKAAEFPRMWG